MSSIQRMILVDENHFNMMRKFGGGVEEPTVPTLTYDEVVVADLPKTLRSKGAALVGFFKRNGIGHDSKGRLTYKNQSIPESNYRDLLSDLVRYRDVSPPYGFQSLARILKNLNVGRELITNLARYKYINELPDVVTGGDALKDVNNTETMSQRIKGRRSVGIKRSRSDDLDDSVAKKWVAF